MEIDFLDILLISVCKIKTNAKFLQPTKGSNYKKTIFARQNTERLTAVWQNGGFSAKLNIRISNKH